MKKVDNDKKTTPWLEREQKIGLSNVFVGFTIAGGLTIFSYLFVESNITGADALTVVEGTLFSVVLLLWFRKE